MKHALPALIAAAAMFVIACDDTTEPAYHVTVNPADFVANIDNPYYPLTPGRAPFLPASHEPSVLTSFPFS